MKTNRLLILIILFFVACKNTSEFPLYTEEEIIEIYKQRMGDFKNKGTQFDFKTEKDIKLIYSSSLLTNSMIFVGYKGVTKDLEKYYSNEEYRKGKLNESKAKIIRVLNKNDAQIIERKHNMPSLTVRISSPKVIAELKEMEEVIYVDPPGFSEIISRGYYKKLYEEAIVK